MPTGISIPHAKHLWESVKTQSLREATPETINPEVLGSAEPIVSSLPGGTGLPGALSCHWELPWGDNKQCFSTIQYTSWVDLSDYAWWKVVQFTAWISLNRVDDHTYLQNLTYMQSRFVRQKP